MTGKYRKTMVMRAVALSLAAVFFCGTAQAKHKSVRPDEIAELQKAGKIASFEKLNQAALAKHPGGSITKTSLSKRDDRYDYRVTIATPGDENWNLKLDAGTAAVLTDSKVKPPAALTPYVPPPAASPAPKLN